MKKYSIEGTLNKYFGYEGKATWKARAEAAEAVLAKEAKVAEAVAKEAEELERRLRKEEAVVWCGISENIANNGEEWIREYGHPSCIVDNNPGAHGTMYPLKGEDIPVISMNEALQIPCISEVYILVDDDSLMGYYNDFKSLGIPHERIHFLGSREYRLGCQNMNYYIYISSDNIKTCAHFPYTNHFFYNKDILTKEDVISNLNTLETWRINTIDAVRRGEKTTCDGCSALQYGIYTKTPRVEILGVGPNFAGGTKCNCNCFYCNQNQVIRTGSNQKLSNYDIHKIAAEYYPTLDTTILADGEPTILPNIDYICDMAIEKNWSIQLNTNAIIYTDKIAEAVASNEKSFMAIALDSGTRETYKRIKRVDTFDRVIENLHKYREKGCNMFLKYILIPGYNDNLEDISKFIDIVKDLRVTHVTLSQNMSGFVDGVGHDTDPNIPESLFMYFTYFIARLQEEDIYWDNQVEFISAHDLRRMERLRR